MTDSHDVTNADRAAWAAEALAIFTDRTYGGDHPDTMHPDDLESAIIDLIADLLHYARQRGYSASDALSRAQFHFEADIAEQEDAHDRN